MSEDIRMHMYETLSAQFNQLQARYERLQTLVAQHGLIEPEPVSKGIPPSENNAVKISNAMRRRMQERGLEFPVPPFPLTVVMEDPIMHTVNHPVCDDPDCICYYHEYEQIAAEREAAKRKRRRKPLVERNYEDEIRRAHAPLNGNSQGFHLLK